MAPPQPRRALDLFTGQGSIARYCRMHGFDEVITLDIDPKSKATHTVNILDWDYKAIYPPGYFDLIHGSPCCVMYSCARTTGGPRDIEGANKLVLKTIEIIQYFKPRRWMIENSGTGLLKKQPFMFMLPSVFADYCMYSREGETFHYRKRSQFWLNNPEVLANPPLLCNGQCDGIRAPVEGAPPGRRTHADSFGGQRGGKRFYRVSNLSLSKKHSIPQALLEKLIG